MCVCGVSAAESTDEKKTLGLSAAYRWCVVVSQKVITLTVCFAPRSCTSLFLHHCFALHSSSSDGPQKHQNYSPLLHFLAKQSWQTCGGKAVFEWKQRKTVVTVKIVRDLLYSRALRACKNIQAEETRSGLPHPPFPRSCIRNHHPSSTLLLQPRCNSNHNTTPGLSVCVRLFVSAYVWRVCARACAR